MNSVMPAYPFSAPQPAGLGAPMQYNAAAAAAARYSTHPMSQRQSFAIQELLGLGGMPQAQAGLAAGQLFPHDTTAAYTYQSSPAPINSPCTDTATDLGSMMYGGSINGGVGAGGVGGGCSGGGSMAAAAAAAAAASSWRGGGFLPGLPQRDEPKYSAALEHHHHHQQQHAGMVDVGKNLLSHVTAGMYEDKRIISRDKSLPAQ